MAHKVDWRRDSDYYSLATAERVPVTVVMIDVSSLDAALLKGEAP